MAVTYTRTLQNRSAQHPFMLTASMTRHYLGFHGATDLPNSGEEWVSAQWLADMHLPSYEAQMVEAQAEGIMCSCNTLRVGPGDGSAGGIPACVHPLLYDVLRNRWNSSALVQMDNEALYPMFQDHHYFPTLGAAIVGALDAGVVAIDSGQGAPILAELAALVEAGDVSEAQVDAFALRTFLLRFRLGEFDSHNPLNPYARAWDESLLDGPEHRALAREAVTKSVALLKNSGGFLPLAAAPKQVAVIGPWGACTDASGSYGCNMCMFGNYAATTSVASGVLDALREEVGASSNVTFAQGTDPYALSSPTGIADAAALAAASDLTILVLGLGCDIETESHDRPFLRLPQVQDELLAAVGLAKRPGAKLLLVTVSANVIDLDAEAADAWLQAFLPGEEAGHGLMDLIFGRASPSARLPLTLYADEYLQVCGPTADFNMVSAATGVGRTYRFADRIPEGLVKAQFGFGLSYSRFTYSALAATVLANSSVSVSVTVANSGGFSPAREVVQLYVSVPSVAGLVTPLRALRGFSVATLASGAPQTLSFVLAYPDAFLTTAVDGSRAVTGGVYAIAVSGHQEDDALGAAQSNVVKTTVALPASATKV
jgi:beta-glucosidase-like glycosyl hydrolase